LLAGVGEKNTLMRILFGTALLLLTGWGRREMSEDELFRTGSEAWKHNDFLSATEWYLRATALKPDSAEPLYNLALSYYRLGWYGEAARYLDRAQPLARGPLATRCTLLHANLEYRKALAGETIRQVEGLERALVLYRNVLATSREPGLSGVAKYNIEVVKLRLPSLRRQRPDVPSSASAGQQGSPEEIMSGSMGPKSRVRGQPGQDERDW
jgi:tetratricopeptide (TPR) repeat protein